MEIRFTNSTHKINSKQSKLNTMARNVNLHRLTELANIETINEILLDTRPQIELHIISKVEKTIIKFPYGNKIEIVDGCLIVYDL